MPAIVAPFVAFALGVVLALYARRDADRYEERERRDATRIVGLFAAAVFAPVTGYFVMFAGDWSLAYLAEAHSVPSAIGLIWVAGSAAAMPLGFIAALRAARRGARRELVVLGALPAAIAFIFIVALYPELRLEGSTREVRGGFGTQPVAGSPLGWAILWMDAALAIGFVVALRALVPPRLRHATAPIPPVAKAPPPPSADQPRLLGQKARGKVRDGATEPR